MLWEFTPQQWLTTFTLICCVSFIGGWLADRILGYAGYSAIGNWLILLLGAYLGLLCYNLFGYRFQLNSHFAMTLAVGSATAFLFTMLSIKAIFRFR